MRYEEDGVTAVFDIADLHIIGTWLRQQWRERTSPLEREACWLLQTHAAGLAEELYRLAEETSIVDG